ncbi:MAG: hypothetical protein ACFE68_01625 [Candidatus Hodarchaeota archaeon]
MEMTEEISPKKVQIFDLLLIIAGSFCLFFILSGLNIIIGFSAVFLLLTYLIVHNVLLSKNPENAPPEGRIDLKDFEFIIAFFFLIYTFFIFIRLLYGGNINFLRFTAIYLTAILAIFLDHKRPELD